MSAAASAVSPRDRLDLLGLGALWGASFLFMRLGAADFGAVPLVFVRVAVASALLLPLLAWRGGLPALRQHWRPIALVGLVNSALPFVLFTQAALVLGVGLMSVFNATAPIWAALIAWLWLGERLGAARALGLLMGVLGVVGLTWNQAELRPGSHGISPALGIAACLAAAICYGLAANLSRQWLVGVPPMAVAAGSQISAALLTLLPALWLWPPSSPPSASWLAATALGLVCTGWAYVLYFGLIARVGAASAISVTFLIPGFAMLWGWMFMGERPTAAMLVGCGVILLGTALSTGTLRFPARREGP